MAEDLELSLEVQVDPDSKKILSSPEKCRSTLLDVTVLKPNEVEAFGTPRTNTLPAVEVRKLISSLEKQRRRKQKVLDKLKCGSTIVKVRKHENHNNMSPTKASPRRKENVPPVFPIDDDLERKDFIGITESVEPLFCEIRRSLKNVETRITNMQDINLVVSQTTVDESASEEFIPRRRRKHHTPFTSYNHLKVPSVYRAEATPHHDLRSVLVKNKGRYVDRYDKGDKIEGKCLCENCGVIGLLMECQKHPLISELSESPSPSSLCADMKSKKRKTRFYMSNLDSTKNKFEESGYVNQLSNRVKLLEDRLAVQEEKIVPKDYFRKIMSKVVTNFTSNKGLKSKSNTSMACSEKQKKKKDIRSGDNKPISFSQRSKETIHKEEKCVKTDKSTITEEDAIYNGYIWKWGEEILKPGIDLKNRIVTLLNDMLGKFALREKTSTSNFNENNNKKDEYTSDTIKKFIEQINTNVYSAHVNNQTKLHVYDDNIAHYDDKRNFDEYRKTAVSTRKEYEEKPERSLREHHVRKDNVKNVNISYINPKLSQWRKDSHCDLKGKQEFLKIAAKAKQHQKDILWKNIWTQAKANGQNKDDKITIKIPVQSSKNGKDKHEMIETELTIGEVEVILKGRY